MLIHKGTQTLTTGRLTLRRLTADDAPAMFDNWASDDNTTKYLIWDTYTEAEKVREFLEKCVADYEKPDCYHWVIEYGGDIVGTINLHSLADKQERCELGYCIGSRWWNRGIVTEAAGAVIDFAFTELNANKVMAFHDVQNAASGRVMQKCGMTRQGVLREHTVRRDGTRGDLIYYELLRREWPASKK